MIEVHQLSVRIAKKQILKNISLEVNPGEVVAVIGANGAGKSTLLKAISGQTSFSGGEVFYNSQPLRQWKSKELARKRAILSQHINLSFSLKVIDVVMLGRFPFFHQENEAQRRMIAQWALEKVALADFAQREIHTLSGGEQQRVHFARVLCQLHSPDESGDKFMLLDEPTASQDLSQQYRLLTLAKEVARELNYGVLIILHDMNQAARFADRIIMMKQGRIVASGSPGQVLTRQHIFQAFQVNCLIQDHPVFDCLHVTALGATATTKY